MTILTLARYEQLVSSFAQRSLIVVGDIMADEYLYGQVKRISPESPVVVVAVQREEMKPGGAANVANNLHALGARVWLVGLTGEDEMAKQLNRSLEDAGIDTCAVLQDPTRPTTRKTRVVAQRQQVARVDREKTHPPDAALQDKMRRAIEERLVEADAVLVSDYRKGTLTEELVRGVVQKAISLGKPVIANPKPGSAPWFAGASALSLNQIETEDFTGPLPTSPKAFEAVGAALRAKLEIQMLITTLGPRGLAYWMADGEHRHVPAHALEVFDVAGAGDTSISALALALISGATPLEAARVANHAGACAVRKLGVAIVSPHELIADWEE